MSQKDPNQALSTARPADRSADKVSPLLETWRTQAMGSSLKILALVFLAGLLIYFISSNAFTGTDLVTSILLVLCYLGYLFLVFYPAVKGPVRGWGLVTLGYACALLWLSRSGLEGSGRFFLLAMPVAAALLLSFKAAYITFGLSAVLVLGFMLLSGGGAAQASWGQNPLPRQTWLIEGTYTLVALLALLAVFNQVSGFLQRLSVQQDAQQTELEDLARKMENHQQDMESRSQEQIVALNQAVADAEQARKAAEQANRTKSSFLATMSHELRTPLSGIIGMTTLLMDTPLTLKQKEFTEIIRQSGETLLSLINDILDFSKIEAGRMDLNIRPFHLRHSLESVVNVVAPRAAEKDLNLACLIEEDIPVAIQGDENRLKQVLLNLLSNAVKFTEQGEVSITVSSEAVSHSPADAVEAEPSRRILRFSVQDSGIGIAPEQIPHLFQPFSQLEAAADRQAHGTGLGLAISQRLVELMGGKIQVESSPGKGSTFWFTIPVSEASLQPRPSLLKSRLELSGKRILIVDDNPTNRRILSLQVQAWGMTPRASAHPDDALAWLRQGEIFDAALLDMQMAEMNGVQLAEEIVRLPQGRNLPLVLLTSLGTEGKLEKNGLFRAVLNKPVKTSNLYNTLISIFSGEIEALLRDKPGTGSLFDSTMGKRHPLDLLVVEDNKINQNLVLMILERLGYHAAVAGNGVEALRALHQRQYDVVLMDVQMPEMDGLEATRRIRKEISADRQPRIIAMTANAMTGDRESCLQAGMDDYISKPIHVDALTRSLEQAQALPKAPEYSDLPSEPTPRVTIPRVETNEPSYDSQEDSLLVLDTKELTRLQAVLGARANEMMPSLVQNFFRQAEKLMDDLDQQIHALNDENRQPIAEIRRLAHTLKSNCASFGVMRVARTARTIENLARIEDLQEVPGLINRCRAEFTEARQALEQFQSRSSLS